MKLANQQSLPVSQANAWAALNDIALLQQSIPGCESITPAGDNSYAVSILASIGPVKAKFQGKLQLLNLDPPNAYTLRFEGQGGAAGHGKGSADIRLQSTGLDTSILHYDVVAQVGGRLAQIGSRLVDMAAQKMVVDFFESFTAKLQECYANVPPTPVLDRPRIFGRFVAWLRQLFSRR